MKISIGEKVYCDIHPKSQEHIVTHLFEDKGFAGIDNKFYWPINQCFPCRTTKLPSSNDHELIRKFFSF